MNHSGLRIIISIEKYNYKKTRSDIIKKIIIILLVILMGLLTVLIDKQVFKTREKSEENFQENGEVEDTEPIEEDTEPKGLIIIDPGHGGFDPGKVGINGELEKDINLEIALKLKEYLEASGFETLLTRESDIGLYSEGSSNKKREDLSNRVEIMNQGNPLLIVSIHQNSYSDSSCKGAQVFYYESSDEGKLIAEYLQESLRLYADTTNKRQIKANTSYYILTKTKQPTVIVECGFLSNSEEASKLTTKDYQDKVANAINTGIITYIESKQ